MSSENQESKEPQKVIALFIDILGFSNLIIESQENWGNAINKLNEIEHKINDIFLKNETGKFFHTIKIFSDNIYCSISLDEDNMSRKDIGYEISDFIRFTYDLIWYFLDTEIFIRGGIAVGTQYISDAILFGTALLFSYNTESKVAVYPRIALHESFLDLLQQYSDQTPVRNISLLCIKDDNAVHYFDYMALWNDWYWTEEFKKKMFSRHYDIIIKQLEENTDKRVLPKYLWLAKYHNFYGKYLDCEIDIDKYQKKHDITLSTNPYPRQIHMTWNGIDWDRHL